MRFLKTAAKYDARLAAHKAAYEAECKRTEPERTALAKEVLASQFEMRRALRGLSPRDVRFITAAHRDAWLKACDYIGDAVAPPPMSALPPTRAESKALNARAVLTDRTVAGVRAAYHVCRYRVGAGVDSLIIVVGAPPSACCETSKGARYSSRCMWRRTDTETVISVGWDWLETVHARELAAVDELLTLSAVRIPGEDEAYDCLVVRQGRGCSLVVERQVILTVDGLHVHGPNLKAAKATMAKRRAHLEAERRSREEMAALAKERHKERREALMREFGPYLEVVVTLDDSKAAGNCLIGTKDWCGKNLGGRTEATISEALEAALTSGDRLDLVLGALRKGVKRAGQVAA